MTTIYGGRAARRYSASLPGRRRSLGAPLLGLVWFLAGAVLLLWWRNTPAVVSASDWLIGAGRITGLLAGYGAAVLVAMMSRAPVLERRVGSDRMARWHAIGGRYVLSLAAAHAVLIVWGYAELSGTGVLAQTVVLVVDYPEMIKTAIGAGLLLVVAFVSAGAIRRRVSYETWYYLHLATYVALYLAFWHQLALGSEFLGDDVARAGWYGLYIGVAGLVVWYRILAPIRLNLRHRLRVNSVVPEASDVVSILISGRQLRALPAEPGQFFRWRFLTRGLRWSANPYSLSAFPRPDLLRITVKATGDHSAALHGLRPGTRVWAEGPYGALTAARRSSSKVLLIAGGVGITPLRALFEVLPAREGDLTLMYWAHREEDLALREELATIAIARRAQLHFAVNRPDGRQAVPLDSATLRSTVPDIAEHDVYLCGPPGMTDAALRALRDAGVPKRRIHHESFEL